MQESSRSARREGFTGELWRSIEGIYIEILGHPFLRGLIDGTLAEERFRFYVLQDALYLREYARALSLAGVRSPDEDALVMFNEHSAGAITVERSLHEGFLKDLSVVREEAEAAEASPLPSPTPAFCSERQLWATTRRCSGRCCRATGSTRR